ncbi:MAG: dienelactone hydrolase family protein [Nevskiaceae bacterium]|jgi:carboxymethylenebutenolidase|nr:dienelactone hydrolase family protein [Nevskiaceae bacterium]
MCDEHSFDDMQRAAEINRRRFGALGVGAGLAAVLPACGSNSGGSTGPDASAAPPVASTNEIVESEVSIQTPDGVCDAHFAYPASGATAAVLVWPDIFGLRDAFRQMGKRLAESGYAVLTVNPFYRIQKAPTSAPNANFSDPATRESLTKMMGSLTATTQVADAKAFVAWLDAQPQVNTSRGIGTTGYCMGGPIVFRTMGTNPERVRAGGSFHGAGLTTDQPDSPHLQIANMRGSLLVAIAQNDDERDPKSKDILRETFAGSQVTSEVEVYPAQHGWCAIDSQVYDQAQAEKAWGRMLEFFGKELA